MKRDNIIKNIHETTILLRMYIHRQYYKNVHETILLRMYMKSILLRMYMKLDNIIKNVHETRQYY